MIYRQVLSNGQIRYRKLTNPDLPGIWIDQKRVVKELQKAILSYLSIKKIDTDTLQNSHFNKMLRPGLAAHLLRRRLISDQDQVYIVGTQFVDKKPGFQVGIGSFENWHGNFPPDAAWYVWTAHELENGYQHSGRISRNTTLNRR